MSESIKQHTPGPWELSGWDHCEKTISVIGSTAFYGKTAFAWIDRDDCDHDEAVANARLIASSPDLLQALRDMVSLHEQEWHEELPASRIDDIIKNAHAAIAKAEGAKHD